MKQVFNMIIAFFIYPFLKIFLQNGYIMDTRLNYNKLMGIFIMEVKT